MIAQKEVLFHLNKGTIIIVPIQIFTVKFSELF